MTDEKLDDLPVLATIGADDPAYGINAEVDYQFTKDNLLRRELLDDSIENRVFNAGDRVAWLSVNSPIPATRTVPLDATFNFRIGTLLAGAQIGAGTVTIEPETVGVTIIQLDNDFTTLAPGAEFYLRKVGVNLWLLSGNLQTLASFAILFDGALSTLNAPVISVGDTVATYAAVPASGIGGVEATPQLPDQVARVFAITVISIDADTIVFIGLMDTTLVIDDIQTPVNYANKTNLFTISTSAGILAEGDSPPGLSQLFPLPAAAGDTFFFTQNATDWRVFADGIALPRPKETGYGNLNAAHTKLFTWLENTGGVPAGAEYTVISEAADLIALGFSTYQMPAGVKDWGGTPLGLVGSKQPFSTVFNTNTGLRVPGRLSNGAQTANLDIVTAPGAGDSPLCLSNVLYGPDITGGILAFEVLVDALSWSATAGTFIMGFADFFGGQAVQITALSTGTIFAVDTDGGLGSILVTLAAGDRLGVEMDIAGNAWSAYYKPAIGPQVTILTTPLVTPNFFALIFQQYVMSYSGTEILGDGITVSLMQDGTDYLLTYSPGATNSNNEGV